jgi:glycosyltransferase involved in cell wall biosynthesis
MSIKKMKILQIIYESPGSPFGFGGAGVRAGEIYQRLKDRHDITLLCMRYPSAEDGEIRGLKYIFAGTESSNLIKSVLAYTFHASDFVRRYGNEFDIIVENFLPATPFFAKYLTKTPVVLQIQDFWGRHTFKRYPIRFSLPMFLAERCYPKLYKQFIFVSDVTKESFNLHANAKTATIPNGIDSNLLKVVAKEDNYMLFISSIDFYKKGLDILLNAFSMISPRYRNIELYIAGNGRDFDTVRNEVEKLPSDIRKNIRLLGWVSGDRKASIISKALFVLLPSRHESQPISLLEAAACGKPVIVSDIPELAFVRREGYGLSFPSGSANGLADKISLLLSDNKKREVLGKLGREFAAQFSWDDIAVQFENVLKQTIH